MGKHVARETTTTRGKLALGVVAVLVALSLLLGSQGSLAFWRTSGTVPGATISSGTIDLTVGSSNAQGKPAPYVESTFTAAGLLPGETMAATIQINNAGTSDFSWIPTASIAGSTAVVTDSFKVTAMSVGSVKTESTVYPKAASCQGAPVVSGTTATRLNRGAGSQSLCVQVKLLDSASSAVQGKSATVTVAVSATQEKRA